MRYLPYAYGSSYTLESRLYISAPATFLNVKCQWNECIVNNNNTVGLLVAIGCPLANKVENIDPGKFGHAQVVPSSKIRTGDSPNIPHHKPHPDRFIHVCRAHIRDRQTHWQNTSRVTIGHTLCYDCKAMQPKKLNILELHRTRRWLIWAKVTSRLYGAGYRPL